MPNTTITELLGAEATPQVLHHNGRDYRAREITLEFMTSVERYLQERDRRAILTTAAGLGADVVAKLLEPHANKVKEKAFRWWGPEYLAWIGKPEGVVEFCRLAFDCTEAELEGLVQEHGGAVVLMVEQTLLDALPESVADQVRKTLAAEKEKARRQEVAPDPLPSAGST